MEKEYLVRITSRPAGCEELSSDGCKATLAAGNWSNTVKNVVTVCGNERLQLTGGGAEFVQTFNGDGTTLEAPIDFATYGAWFEVGNSGAAGISS